MAIRHLTSAALAGQEGGIDAWRNKLLSLGAGVFLIGCGLPEVRVVVTTAGDGGEVVPAAGAKVEIFSAYGVAGKVVDGDGVALFRRLKQNSSWVPSIGPGDGPPKPYYSVSARIPRRACRSVHQTNSFRGGDIEVRLHIPPVATFNVPIEDGVFAPHEQRYLRIQGADYSQEVNIGAIDACVVAGDTFQATLILDDFPVHEWKDVILRAGEGQLLPIDQGEPFVDTQ